MNLNRSKISVLLALFFTAIILYGCVGEDPDNLIRHDLTFEFTKNSERIDLFPAEVTALDVYVFNSEGIYVANFKDKHIDHGVKTYRLPLRLPFGEYTVVVWGGEMDSFATERMKLGTSTLKEAQLILKQQGTTVDYQVENLYYGRADHITLMQGSSTATHISLTKNTHLLNLTVKGLTPALSLAQHVYAAVVCTASNGQFNFDNSLSASSPTIQYKAFARSESDDEFIAKLSVLRLLPNLDCRLIVKNTTTGEDMFNENLMDLIMQLPPINSAKDLDRQYDFDVVIILNSILGVTVTINGYVVVEAEQDI